MGIGRANGTRSSALMAVVVVCALALQALLAGMATARAASSSGESAFAQSCARTIGATTDEQPATPGGHKHGLCCILHSAGLAGADVPLAVGEKLAPVANAGLAASGEDQGAARPTPEREPLAPRGPPAFQI